MTEYEKSPYNISAVRRQAEESTQKSQERRKKPLIPARVRQIGMIAGVSVGIVAGVAALEHSNSTPDKLTGATQELTIEDGSSVWQAAERVAEAQHTETQKVVEAIKELNGIESFGNLQKGQVLKIPAVLPEDQETHVS